MSPSPDKIKVIRLVPVLDFGGVESIVALQAALLDPLRFELRVCTFWRAGRVADKIRALGVPVDVLNVDPAIRNPRATAALAAYIAHHRPHIIHASIGEANLHAALVGKLMGAGAVMMEETGLPNRAPLGRLIHALLYRMVDKIIGVSDASCRYVIEREYAPPERVERLYNAVDPGFYLPTPDRRSRDRIRFVSTGRLVPVKNYQMLIESFLPVAAAHPRASLVIAGDGPLRDVLRARIEALGLADRVTLLGFCGQVRELLDDADAFVIPSLAEGMCISLAEALARGLPAIATTAGGAGELVAPLGPGWAQPPDMPARWTAAMLRLIEVGPEERARLGEAARVRAMAFHPDQHRLQLEAIYSSLASPHRSQP